MKRNHLDFTTLSVHRNVIRHQHAWNARAASQICDRIVAITREPSGELAAEGSEDPVEYALRMRRFPRAAELSSIANAGNLTIRITERPGTAAGGYHMVAKERSKDGTILIREITGELK